ncbi:DUF1700 domain-containing protein [Microbacterium sp. ARD32]|uniref:HAAS signaling domain-containing protein n=1 Tax=Microbacterium sp. ARD32 TaxID=2962577 RepID=UPI002880D128|nr:DUF1700 domain-containing protein [Microbacterium sp. ARD32]MDT0157874.1 DUF1700 domain-containing protein [Microbacterium sp. ARD32]
MTTKHDYLRSVERMLRGIDAEHRTAVLEDLRGHFADAEDAGRPVDEIIRGLGAPREIADRAVEEFGADAGATDARAERAWRVLQGAAVALAVVIGVVAAFIMPSFRTDRGDLTLFEMEGLWLALLPLAPVLAVAIPLVVSRAARTALTLISIMLQLMVSAILWLQFGGLFLPSVALTIAALTVWHGMRARGFGLAWRILGAVLTIGPFVGLFALHGDFLPLSRMPRRYADYSAVDGGGPSIGIDAAGWLIAGGIIILAVLMVIGIRWAGWALGAAGLVLLLGGLLSGALLTLLLVWLGGLWLTIGLAHSVTASRRT